MENTGMPKAVANHGYRSANLWIAVLFLAAATLRAWGLNSGLWYDEIRTLVDSVRHPIWQILTTFPSNNQHSLYSILAHAAINTLGEDAWTLRLPAFLFGVASVPALFALARQVTDRREAILATLLLTVSYHHVWFSQNGRGYSALAFFAILSTWLLLLGYRDSKRKPFVWYALVVALGAYTHLTFVFVVLSHALISLWKLGVPGFRQTKLSEWTNPAIAFVLAGFLTLLLYSPVFLDLYQFFAKRPSPMEVATPKWALFELWRGLGIGFATGFAGLLGGALVLAGFWSYFRQDKLVWLLFLLPGLVTVVAAVAARRPIFPRFLFFLVGFAFLVVVRGATVVSDSLGRHFSQGQNSRFGATFGTVMIGILIVFSLGSLHANYRFPKQDYEGAMRFVQSRQATGDLIAVTGLTVFPYRTYYGQPWEQMESLESFKGLRRRGPVWVLYTMPAYVESRSPDLMQALRQECQRVGVFRGTVGGGDVVVCRAEALLPSRP